MRRIAWCAALLAAVAVGRCDVIAAQEQQPTPPATEPAPQLEVEARPPWETARSVLRIGQDYTVRPDERVRDVTVVFGNVLVEGQVDGALVVVFGTLEMTATAFIDEDVVVIGGTATAASGARVDQDFVVIGAFEGEPGFAPRGEHVVIGPVLLGGLEAFVPWLTRGLLWGRLIVPDLPWVWAIAGTVFLVYLALNLVFGSAVRACAVTLADRPLTAFLVGLLVLLLTGPVCVLLAVSVVGLAVVPFVLGALLIAGILGNVATARWIGMRAAPEAPDNVLHSVRSLAIGFAIVCVAYTVPLLGVLTWSMLAVLGLGAAALAFMAGYRRENPLPARRIPPVAASDVPAASAAAPAGAEATGGTGATSFGASETTAGSSAAPAQLSDLTAYPHAGFADRTAAFALDVVLVLIAYQLLDLTRRDSGVFLLLLAYHIGFWTWKGTTVGGIICQLRLVRVDGSRLRFVDAFVRGLSAIFSLAVVGLGALWILRDPERQAWHDKIAGTYVVKVPRNYPL